MSIAPEPPATSIPLVTAASLNAMPTEERIKILKGPFGKMMHAMAGTYAAPLWWIEPPQHLSEGDTSAIARNASMFFLEIGGQLFGVTAAHVYRGYLEVKNRGLLGSPCHVGNFEFDPQLRIHSMGGQRNGVDNVDIATFKFTHSELTQIGKRAITASQGDWPPRHPFSGQSVYFAGFPGTSRRWIDEKSISFGMYVAAPMVGTVTDLQFTFPFDRNFWVDMTGHGLPPEGFDLGGVSRGPVLMPKEKDGVWSFELAGVLSESQASHGFETLIAVPAHFIAMDGTIYDERSAPNRHAVPAK